MEPVQGLDTPAYSKPGIAFRPYLLSILNRLYTSVIPLMSEKLALKESWSTDMSPTAHCWALQSACTRVAVVRWGGVYPGWVWDRVGAGGGYTGTQPGQSQDPIFSIYLA